MMSVLKLIAWESGSYVKNRKQPNTQESRQKSEYRSSFELTHKLQLFAFFTVKN